MKLYEKLQPTETCPYCKKNKIIGGKETVFIITTQGCRVCRIKNKYLFIMLVTKKLREDIIKFSPLFKF